MASRSRVLVKTLKRGVRELTPAGLDVVEQMVAGGKSKGSIAKELGISAQLFRKILDRDGKVKEFYDRGIAKLEDWATDRLMKMAEKGNVTALIYLTKARLGWNEAGPPVAQTNVQIVLPQARSEADYMQTIEVKQR